MLIFFTYVVEGLEVRGREAGLDSAFPGWGLLSQPAKKLDHPKAQAQRPGDNSFLSFLPQNVDSLLVVSQC